jgi:hypothetical protein
MLKKILPLLLVPLLLAGCATTFTNLTPTEQPRNAENLYPVEVRFDSNQKALRWESIEPKVLVGEQSYPMRLVPMMRNRWECLVPVPGGSRSVEYRYKFDFLVNEFGGPQPDTAISRPYLLKVVE